MVLEASASGVRHRTFNQQSVTVEVTNYTPQGVNNPLVVRADVGDLEFRLTGLNSTHTDQLSGTLISGDVRQSATLNAWLNSLDWRKIGDQTRLMDWTYRDDARGVVRVGSTSTDFRGKTEPSKDGPDWPIFIPPPNNNSLNFATRNTAKASLVLSGAKFSTADPINLDAYDTSQLKLRLQDYYWKNPLTKMADTPFFFVHLTAHDTAQIFSRFDSDVDDIRNGFAPSIYWQCDLNAKQKIEGIEKLQEVNGALTVWRGFNQFLRPIEEDNAQGAITNLSRNYSGADVGSLEIPEP